MTRAPQVIGILALAAATAAAQESGGDVAYMRYVRPVFIEAPGRQAYGVVDETTWNHARGDLGDVRLRAGDDQPVPFALRTRGATDGVQELRARILQSGRLREQTRFWIEIPDAVREYDRVRLELRTRNFVAAARVEGADDESSRDWIRLGEHSLFDFSGERLGSNTVLQLPPTRFRYLRVTLPGEVRPDDIVAAHVPVSRRQDAHWLDLAVVPAPREEGTRTVFAWRAAEHVPLDGVHIEVAADQRNFIRRVEIMTGGRVVATGTIRRVHRVHAGRPVDVEELDLPVPAARGDSFEAVIHNADDPPLRIARVTPRVLERRLYFDAGDRSELELYFGDDDARAPEYEYARLFIEANDARPARLGPVAENHRFTPRPDLRPWSERHPAVVWTALALAVLVMGVLAVRALRQA